MRVQKSFQPNWVSSPGDTLAEAMGERGITVSGFARGIQESEERVARLLEGREPVTVSLAKRMASVLGGSMQFWIARDALYREAVAQRATVEERDWLAALPVADMTRLGWLGAVPAPGEEYRECLKFFGVGGIQEWRVAYQGLLDSVAFRAPQALDSLPGAVAAWLRAAQIAANGISVNPFSPEVLRQQFKKLRALTKRKDPRNFLPALQQACAEAGVAVCVVPAPSGCRAYGAVYTTNGSPIVVLSARQLTDDQFWFTLFHELAHVILHPHRNLVLEGMDTSAAQEEMQANNFASAVIVPSALLPELHRLPLTADAVLRFAAKAGLAPGLVVGQLQHMKRLPPSRLNSLKRRYIWKDGSLSSRERR